MAERFPAPFLEARHVDDLIDAVRALTMQMAQAARHHQETIDVQRKQLEVLAEIRDCTEALREVIVHARTNGHAHAETGT